MKSLFKTVALITVFSVLTRILGFVFRIFLSRIVGAEALGIYQVAFSVFMVLLTIISSGLPLIISRMSATFLTNKENKKEASLVSVSVIYSLVLSIILCLLVLAFRGLFSFIFTDARCLQILIILLPSLIFSSVYSSVRGALWGRGIYFALCISELYEQVVRIILSILVLSTSLSVIENALNIAWTLSLACLLSMIFVILLYFYYGGCFARPRKSLLKPLIKQSTPITFMRVASSFIQPLIAVIIPARLMAVGYTNSQAMSLYGVAVGMTMPLLYIPTTLIGSLSTALVPDISTALAQNDQKHISHRVNSSISFALFISAMFIPVFLGMGELMGVFLYDNIMSGTLLQSASWILIPMGLTNISSALLNSLGLEKKSFINFVIGSVFMFLALWLLPSLVGINALIWGMGINYLITAVLNLRLLKKQTKVEFKLFKTLLKYLLLIIPSSALTAFTVSLCEYVFPAFVVLMIGGIVSVSSFLLLAEVMNIIDVKAFMISMLNKVKLPKLKKKLKNKKVQI